MTPRRGVLVVDQGTTSTRAIVFGADAAPLATVQQEFRQIYPHPGWIEHAPEDLWQTTLTTLRGALQKAGLQPTEVAALGITNQRETALLWSRKTGEPIHNAIVWQDRRTADLCARLESEGAGALVAERTGLLLDPYFSATKIAWLLDHVPGARARAERGELAFGTVDTYLLWRLTQGAVHATDATNAARTLLLDIRTGTWDDELLRLFRVPASLLPEVRDTAGEFGSVAAAHLGAAVPIRAVAGDQQAALIGQACLEPRMVKATFGTGGFVLLNTGPALVRSSHRLLTTIAYQWRGARHYALEGSIFAAGATVQWLRDALGIVASSAEASALAAEADPEQAVYLVPAFAGLGAPHWSSTARGTITGLTRGTTRKELVARRARERRVSDARSAGGDVCRCRRCLAKRDQAGHPRRWRHVGQQLDDAVPADIVDAPVDRPWSARPPRWGSPWRRAGRPGSITGPKASPTPGVSSAAFVRRWRKRSAASVVAAGATRWRARCSTPAIRRADPCASFSAAIPPFMIACRGRCSRAPSCRNGCAACLPPRFPRRTGRRCALSSSARLSSMPWPMASSCRWPAMSRCATGSSPGVGTCRRSRSRRIPARRSASTCRRRSTGTPFHDTGRAIVKFNSFWTIELEPGYALFATHPVNRADLPFRLLTGLVDADRFNQVGILFPAVWVDPGFAGVLPAGTPVAQCFAVAREAPDLAFAPFSEEERQRYDATAAALLSKPGVYRRRYRARRRRAHPPSERRNVPRSSHTSPVGAEASA